MNGLFKLVLSATTTTALRCMFAIPLSRDSKGAINIKLVLRLRADVLWMREHRLIRTGVRHGDALSVDAIRRLQMQSEILESRIGFRRNWFVSDILIMAQK